MRTKYIVIGILGMCAGVIATLLIYTIFNQGVLDNTEEKTIQTNSMKTLQPEKVIDLEEYIIIGDRVKVRREPSTSSNEVTVLKAGDKVGVVAKSENKQKVSAYEDYWYNIKTQNINGWVFGEYISNKEMLEEKITKRYSEFLKGLNKKDPDLISYAVQVYKSLASLHDNKQVNDNMFRLFKKFYEAQIEMLNKDYFNEDENRLIIEVSKDIEITVYGVTGDKNKINNINDTKLAEKINRLLDNGFDLYTNEGWVYIKSNYDFITPNFEDSVSDGVREYITLIKLEQKDKVWDAYVVVMPWNDIADRIIAWEKFIKKNYTFEEVKEGKKAINNYLNMYIGDIQCSRSMYAQNPNNNTVSQEIKKSFERFISEQKSSDYYLIIKEYYDILKNNNFNYDYETTAAFLKKKGIIQN